METLEATNEEKEIIATVSLLTMVIKSVPQPVLRKKYAEAGDIFLQLIEQFAQSDNQNVVRSVSELICTFQLSFLTTTFARINKTLFFNFEFQIIGCISVLLRAQEYASWTCALSLKLFNRVLSYVTHTKPCIRKAAQRAVESIIHGSCFIIAPSQEGQTAEANSTVPIHPAGTYVAKFCVEQFKIENLTKSQTVVLYAIELLKKTLHGLKNEDIKEICEYLLSIMVTSKTNIQKNCFDTLDHLFRSKSPNLSQDLIGKLIAAIYDYRPEQTDVNLILAWVNVMKRGHVCLTSFNVSKCLMELPRLVTILAGDLWKSNNIQIATGIYHTLKELLEECVAPGLQTEGHVNLHRKQVTRILNEITKCLNEPYGFISQQVVGVFQTIFEVCGQHFADTLQPSLNQIASRYDDTATKQIQIENAIRAAISTMGPEAALIAAPLVDGAGDVIISRLWVLQALKKAIRGSSFEFFYCKILHLANKCHDQWKDHQAKGNLAAARTNELFYIQLWDLFPSFCEQPKDLNKFGSIAKTLGETLKNRVEVRTAVFSGLIKLLQSDNDECKAQLSRFSRNYLNILLNIYTKKPSGSEEHTSHTNALNVIIEYLKVTPNDVLTELFNSIHNEYKSKERIEMILQKVQEINQTVDRSEEDNIQIGEDKAKQIQDAYDLLKNTIQENSMGIEYVDSNGDEIRQLLQTIPQKRLQQLVKNTQQFIGTFAYQAYFELLIALAVYQPAEKLHELFGEYIEPTLRNAKKGGITQLIKERQFKSYELLKNILESENAGCQSFVSKNILQIQKALLNTLQNRKNSSQDIRLT